MKLTAREAEIRELTRQHGDLSTAEIAKRLGISRNTAWFHRRNLDLKLARHSDLEPGERFTVAAVNRINPEGAD